MVKAAFTVSLREIKQAYRKGTNNSILSTRRERRASAITCALY